MTGPVMAILLTLVVHLVGFVLLFALMGREFLDVFRSNGGGPNRDDWPEPEPEPLAPAPSGGGLPLPDAVPASVRLREPGRLSDHHPRRPRRPDHAPEPQRTPERV